MCDTKRSNEAYQPFFITPLFCLLGLLSFCKMSVMKDISQESVKKKSKHI